mmetsp:Transcript_15459/g.40978  ORF Transcript_15459/g.40978 Transcript_15459/m.40978 type:complete len:334 (-) Transcript_15459:364-1365(-)
MSSRPQIPPRSTFSALRRAAPSPPARPPRRCGARARRPRARPQRRGPGPPRPPRPQRPPRPRRSWRSTRASWRRSPSTRSGTARTGSTPSTWTGPGAARGRRAQSRSSTPSAGLWRARRPYTTSGPEASWTTRSTWAASSWASRGTTCSSTPSRSGRRARSPSTPSGASPTPSTPTTAARLWTASGRWPSRSTPSTAPGAETPRTCRTAPSCARASRETWCSRPPSRSGPGPRSAECSTARPGAGAPRAARTSPTCTTTGAATSLRRKRGESTTIETAHRQRPASFSPSGASSAARLSALRSSPLAGMTRTPGRAPRGSPGGSLTTMTPSWAC